MPGYGRTGDPRFDRRLAPDRAQEGEGGLQTDESIITGRRLARLPFSNARALLPPPSQPYTGPDATSAAYAAGRRMTNEGAFGHERQVVDVWHDLRMQANRMSVVPNQPIYQNRLRVAGIINQGETFNSAPLPDRPWLSLRGLSVDSSVVSNDLHMEVVAGMTEGMSARREFFLGGGMTAAFKLDSWDNVKVKILGGFSSILKVQYAWVKDGLENSNQDLVLPQVVSFGAAPIPHPSFKAVPEGAFELFIGQPLIGPPAFPVPPPFGTVATVEFLTSSVNLLGSMRVFVGHDTPSGESFFRWGEGIPVTGTRYAINSITPPAPMNWDIAWRLRPL